MKILISLHSYSYSLNRSKAIMQINTVA